MADQYKTSNPIKDTINAYFNFILLTNDSDSEYIIRIYNMFRLEKFKSFEIYPNTYVMDAESPNKTIAGDKVLSILVVYDNITIDEYFRLVNRIEYECCILNKKRKKIIFLNTEHTSVSLDKIYSDNSYINIDNTNFLIKEMKDKKYLFRDDSTKVVIPRSSVTKISVYAVNNCVIASILYELFKKYQYFNDNLTEISENKADNVYLSSDLESPLKNIIHIIHFNKNYYGHISLHKECIDELVKLAKSKYEILGIIVFNEFDEPVFTYKHNKDYHFRFTVLKDKEKEIFDTTVI